VSSNTVQSVFFLMTALGIAAGVALFVAITLDLREQIEGAANTYRRSLSASNPLSACAAS
jgi:hypothetical protein